MVTFKDIIEQFELFIQNHTQVNGFDFGDISNINSDEYYFPLVFFNPIQSSKEKNLTKIKFDLYIIDILEQDRSNILDVLNNMLIIGNDIVSKFWIDREESLNFELNEENISITPFEGRFDKLTGGWIFNIEILMSIPLDNCSIPLFDYNGSGITCSNGSAVPNPYVNILNHAVTGITFLGETLSYYTTLGKIDVDMSGTWLTTGSTLGFTGTTGSIPFVGSGTTLTEDNSNLFWDDTNKRLGIGTTSPNSKLDVDGNINLSSGSSITTNGVNTIELLDNNTINIGDNAGQNAIGYSNVNIGQEAGKDITGDANLFIGYEAGEFSTASSTVGIGAGSAKYVSSDYGIFIGDESGKYNSGDSTVGIGQGAGSNNSGELSIGIGDSSVYYNTGYGCIGIGEYAGYYNEGENNISIGVESNDSNTGDNVILIGAYTGWYNEGSEVIAIGTYAGNENTGSYSVLIGEEAGDGNTLENQFILKQNSINSTPLIQGDFLTGNVGIGTTSPTTTLDISNTTTNSQIRYRWASNQCLSFGGDNYQGPYLASHTNPDNTSFGNYAATKQKFGSQGFLVGTSPATAIGNPRTFTDRFIITPTGNVGIGTTSPATILQISGGSLTLDDTINSDTGVIYKGSDRFLHNFGTNNIFLGIQAGNFTTSGTGNIGIGTEALKNITTGTYNTILGYNNGKSLSSANGNSLFGANTAMGLTTGKYNSFLGSAIAPTATNAAFNAALGASSFNDLTSGSYNVAIGGINTLVNLTSGDRNTGIGSYAGFTNIIGDRNIFIGNQSGYYETGSDKLFIDNRSRGSEESGRTNALIYGVMADDVADQTLTFNANVGIGTTSPNFKLEVDGGIGTDYIQFNTSATPITNAEGLLQWNSTDGTLDLGMSGGDVTMQIGQELFTKVRNPPGGSTIPNASPVYINGRTGVFPDIALAKSDSQSTSRILGITTQDIESPGFGYVTTIGYVRGIKTNYSGTGDWGTTWVTGDLLWISKTVAGQLTNLEPSAPHHSDIIGTVGIIHANQGSILVTNDKHTTLEELTDVNGTPLTTDGQIIVWNNDNKYFDFDYNIGNYVPYSGATTDVYLGENDLYVGGNVGIGTTTPTQKLDVNGTAQAINIISNGGKVYSRYFQNVGSGVNMEFIQPGTTQDILFKINTSTEAMRIQSSTGNVGIGTTSPVTALDVMGVGRFGISGYQHAIVQTKTFGAIGDAVFGSNSSSKGVAIAVDSSTNSTFIYLKTDGNVGIGTTSPTSTLDVNGSFSTNYTIVTGTTYTIASTDYTIEVQVSGATITLPTAVGITGRIYNIKNTSTDNITLDGDGTETIDGELTQTLSQWENIKVQSNGTNWIII